MTRRRLPDAVRAWAHQRRDFIDCTAGQSQLSPWCRDWLGRIAAIYRLNKTRLSHYRADTGERGEEFVDVQRELESELQALFATAERELEGLDEAARQAAPLRSLLKHRKGLSVFLDIPQRLRSSDYDQMSTPRADPARETSLNRASLVIKSLRYGGSGCPGLGQFLQRHSSLELFPDTAWRGVARCALMESNQRRTAVQSISETRILPKKNGRR